MPFPAAVKRILQPATPTPAQVIRSNAFWKKAPWCGDKTYICTIDGNKFYPPGETADRVVNLLLRVTKSLGKPAPVVYSARFDAEGNPVQPGGVPRALPVHDNFYIATDEDVLSKARRTRFSPRRPPYVTKLERMLEAHECATKLGLF